MRKVIKSRTFAGHAAILPVVFCLFCSLLNAQSRDSAKVIPKASISLKDGATLFSADESFNRQISGKTIIRDKATVAYQKNKEDGKNLEMTAPKTGYGHVTKDSVKEKKKEEPAKKNRKKVTYFFLNNKFTNKYC
ncbi:hypothetical protein [Chryseobacterium sp. 2R14A]|uniref:hypothetical protein n=1 Tax=Chryseobacterium sp. 2R14A TaxID=3380353 RepID=UPI003CF3CB16